MWAKISTTHAGIPETPDVVRHALHTFCLVGLGYEEISDAVRHLDEMVNIHGLLQLFDTTR